MNSPGSQQNNMASKGKGKQRGEDIQQEDVFQAVVIADSFNVRFAPITNEKPKVKINDIYSRFHQGIHTILDHLMQLSVSEDYEPDLTENDWILWVTVYYLLSVSQSCLNSFKMRPIY